LGFCNTPLTEARAGRVDGRPVRESRAASASATGPAGYSASSMCQHDEAARGDRAGGARVLRLRAAPAGLPRHARGDDLVSTLVAAEAEAEWLSREERLNLVPDVPIGGPAHCFAGLRGAPGRSMQPRPYSRRR